MSLEQRFVDEVLSEIAKHPPAFAGTFTEQSIAPLPAPLRSYLRECGWIGRAMPANVRWIWSSAELKRAPRARWMKLRCEQVNSVAEPARLAFMQARWLGILPFEGRDKTQGGHGSMRIELAHVRVGDTRGAAMDASALVTFLAETPMIPSVALQPYVAWEELDGTSARATLTHRDLRVSGVFRFGPDGFRFDTDDRFFDTGGGAPRRVPWSAIASEPRPIAGLRLPTKLEAVWHLPEGDLTYFRGTISDLRYDIAAYAS